MITLFLAWLAWSALALLFGVVIGMSIHLADTVEQPETDDTERIYVPREWVA